MRRMYSVHDSKAAAYLDPFYSTNDGTALRSFVAAARDEKHIFYLHASDYTLFFIGTFDEETSQLEGATPQINLGNALQLTAVTDGLKEAS